MMGGWPELNGLALVDVVDEPVMLQSRVEAVEGTAVTLAAPIGAYGIPVIPTAGETVLVAWSTTRGYFERKGIVEHSERTPQARMTIRPLGDVRRLQRRAHVRVAQLSPVTLTFDDQQICASLLDMSESGVRCVVERPSPLGMDSQTIVTLELLDDRVLELAARPTRMYAIGDDHLEVGLSFTDIDGRTASQIRRHVFAQQVRDRAMGLL